MIKKTLIILGILAILFASFLVYQIHFNYRFTEISKGKVFSSGVIPPEKIEGYVKEHGIKTIIDLRDGRVQDELNPGLTADILKEKKAVEKIDGVEHINIPSLQIPTDETLDKFYKVMSDSTVYPVLIHCYHGVGRAVLYSALYRIEYENFSNEEARNNTRFPVIFSNFDKNTEKGNYLINYKKRIKNTPDSIQ